MRCGPFTHLAPHHLPNSKSCISPSVTLDGTQSRKMPDFYFHRVPFGEDFERCLRRWADPGIPVDKMTPVWLSLFLDTASNS